MKTRFGLRSLFLVLIATALFSSVFVLYPPVPGFDSEFSRKFVVAGLLGGIFAGANLAIVRERFLSMRYVVRVAIATYVATSISYWTILLYAKQYVGVGSWPGMAMISMLPATFFISAISSSILSVCVPKRWMVLLEMAFFPPVHESTNPPNSGTDATECMRYPPAAFLVAVNVIVLGSLMLCLQMDSWLHGLVVVLPVFGPLILALVPMWFCRAKSAQCVFVVATLGYALWFLYLGVFTQGRSPTQAFLGLLNAGAVAGPILFLVSLLGVGLHMQATRD